MFLVHQWNFCGRSKNVALVLMTLRSKLRRQKKRFLISSNDIECHREICPINTHNVTFNTHTTIGKCNFWRIWAERDGTEICRKFSQIIATSIRYWSDKELITSLCILSSPSNISPQELLDNALIRKYTSAITYKHKGVDNQVYERTDSPLLNLQLLKNDVHAFLKIVENVPSITSIFSKLAKHGSELCSEWFRLYQILATFAIDSNEAERMFSVLRRIKSWIRNRSYCSSG